MQPMRIGLITDTHLPNILRDLGELGPEIAQFFSTVDLILHAGDIVGPQVLDWLEQFAPVIAAQGNNDALDDPRVAPVQVLDIAGWRIGMVHSLVPEGRPLPLLIESRFRTPVDIAVCGHTHYERLEHREGVVLINSGSPIFPHHKSVRLGTVGLLELQRDSLHAEIVLLGETPGRPNPGKPAVLDLVDGRLLSMEHQGRE
jgi:putative phosphoesterase